MADKVEIFTMPGCPTCQRAKDHLRRRHTAYVEHNVAEGGEAYDALRAVAPDARAAPVLVVGGRVLEGYSEEELDKALDALG